MRGWGRREEMYTGAGFSSYVVCGFFMGFLGFCTGCGLARVVRTVSGGKRELCERWSRKTGQPARPPASGLAHPPSTVKALFHLWRRPALRRPLRRSTAHRRRRRCGPAPVGRSAYGSL